MKHWYLLPALFAVMCSCSDEPKSGTEKEEEKPDNTPRTVSVIAFDPAPGQFINDLPEYETGDDYNAMLAKTQECFDSGEEISLGAWGGSITLKFSKPLEIAKTGYDFRILGNSYTTGSSGDTWWGSSEPGIIMVMQDTNRNGKPDDTWYTMPVPGVEVKEETVVYTAGSDGNVSYRTSDGITGELTRNGAYHTQSFWPQWVKGTSMTLTGLRLADNGKFNPATFKYEQTCYPNCADSYPNSSERSAIAVREALAPITKVDFVRIYTGVLQCNGPLGECSTEVCGIEFLHD